MEKKVITVLVVVLSLVLINGLSDFITGSYTYNPEIGTSTPKSGLEKAEIEISPRVVKAGEIITVDVYPGNEGVFTGLAVYSSGGKRKYGGLCENQGTADFCSKTYECIDDLPERCNTGTKCFGAKKVKIRTSQNWASGKYVVKVCEAIDECWKCKSPVLASFYVN